MEHLQTEQSVRKLCESVASSLGLEVVLVQYRRESQGWVLRILIDRPGGVTVEDCQTMSREFSDVLDVEDPIPSTYHLEVSSPGLDRPLTKPEDFNRFDGHEVSIRTKKSIQDRRNFKGKLQGFQDGMVSVEVDGIRFEFPWTEIEKANLVPQIK